ncbi:MAG: hypothetical protein A2Y94_01815 [Caldithrix sp. RBG_13_44_9]|nr:MAG: hypothetical protein A2Y94_01815 [Caldithrix sp. RBG_13_44_9]
MEKKHKISAKYISPDKEITENQSLSRDSVFIAIFGAMWGLVEITLGVFMKGMRLPMGGAILTAISSVIFLTGRYFIRRRGSILMMGAIAAILKVFSLGTVIAGPFMAILIESLIAEIAISLLGIHRFSYIFTVCLLTLYTIIHPFIAQGIIFGENIYKIYLEIFQKIAQFLHIDLHYIGWIILCYAVIHLILGATAGWFAYSLSIRVDKELSRQLKGKK